MFPPDEPPDDPDAPDPLRTELARVVRELCLGSGAVLSGLAAERILALKEAAVEPLLAILEDHRLRDPKAPAAGWGPVHAAFLLGRLASPRSIGPLLDMLAISVPPEALGVVVTQALAPLGKQLITPILDRLPTAIGPYRKELWCLLAGTKVRDPRIFDQLLTAFAEHPEEGAMRLAEYGDPAALPYLVRALDVYERGLLDDTRDDHNVFELCEAIEQLGGRLTPPQKAKYEGWVLARKLQVEAGRGRSQPDSPDALCACGSGRPYKNCCLH